MKCAFISFLWVAALVGSAPAAVSVVDTGTVWSCHYTWRPEAIGTAADAKPASDNELYYTSLPAAEWLAPGFDDSDWWFQRAPVLGAHGDRQSTSLAVLSTRAKFGVISPGPSADLKLSLIYRGGVAVFLNGREIARQHLPAGVLTADTLAADYPLEAFTTPEGGRIGPPGEREDNAEINRRLDLRLRRLEVILPRALLRGGENVLALQLHRTARIAGLKSYDGDRANWSTVGLVDVKVTAAALTGLIPVVAPLEGIRLWRANPMQEITANVGYGDMCSPLRPLKIVAPRNGVGSGQVIVNRYNGPRTPALRTAGPITATIDGLRVEGAKAEIPAEAIQIRYAAPPVTADGQTVGYFDILDEQSPESAPVQPVWVTVRVPLMAPAGEYRGTLTINGKAGPLGKVPVHLTVCNWLAPMPQLWKSHVDLIQSYDAIAEHYKVTPWSEPHWKLIEASLQLLGQVGNKVAYITLTRRTHFGNEHGMIRFRKVREDVYQPDFTVLDRYLQLYERHVGRPSALIIYLWEPNMNTRSGRATEVPVTFVDAKGEVSDGALPMFGDPRTSWVWKDLFEGMKERLERRGWREDIVHLGVGADSRPDEETVDLFAKHAPLARWALFTHGRGDPAVADGKLTIGNMAVGYLIHPGNRDASFPLRDKLIGGWDAPFLKASSTRGDVLPYSPFGAFRALAEMTVVGDCRGFARIGLDAWARAGTATTRNGTPIGRFGTNNVLDINLMRDNPRSITAPGPNGALATIRYEMMREGLQETEARIVIERALREQPDKLDADLTARSRAALNERLQMHLIGDTSWHWYATSGWQARTAKFFEIAGEVDRAVRAK